MSVVDQLRFPVIMVCTVLALCAPKAQAKCNCAVLPDLGAARDYPAFGLSGVYVHLQGSAFADNGNIGVGPGGSAWLQGASGIDGIIGAHPGVTVKDGEKATGGVVFQDMTQAEADAIAAATAFAALTPTQTFSNITSTTTVTGNGCINVIQVNGDIDIDGTKRLTMKGGNDDYFVFNVAGDIITSGTADFYLDGMDPDHVIFNVIKAGANVSMGGGSGGDSTFLNIGGEIYLHGNSGGRGAYIAGKTRLKFLGSSDFYGMPFECTNPVCPDPELGGVNIQTPATPPSRSTGNTSYFYSYFDPATYEGHLESYRVAPDGKLKDKLGNDAIDPLTNLLEASRVPFWDAGAELKSNSMRTIYTTKADTRVKFNTSNVSEADLDLSMGELPSYPNVALLGIDDEQKLRDAVVSYVHGRDAFDEDLDSTLTEIRKAVLGDIFHSNPLFIGSPTTFLSHEDGFQEFASKYQKRDRAVYAGANDGMFHAFDAGAWWDPSDATAYNAGSGDELFGYVPGLLLPTVKMTAKTVDAGGARLTPAFVDGNTVAADVWLGDFSGIDTTKSWEEWATVLVAAFRDGGAGYLALDVSDPAAGSGAPHGEYPKYLWEFTHPNLGSSWSKPVITRVKVEGVSGTGDNCGLDDADGDCREQWVVIFGGGYELDGDPNDGNYLADPTSLAWNPTSKAIFIVALDTGEVLAKIQHDATGLNGPTEMRYSIPSGPAVLDLNQDGFADLVLIGDLGGQLWKWDLSNVGKDSNADNEIDNWRHGVFFRTPRTDMGSGRYHYRSFPSPPSAAFVNQKLLIAFGTGEKSDFLYEGDPTKDDNNRFYVIHDPNPTGPSSIGTTVLESDLTDVSLSGQYLHPGDRGYYFKGAEGEKFITEVIIFAGYVLTASFTPDPYPSCGTGDANFYAFEIGNAVGFFDSNAVAEASDRMMRIGGGIPSNPRMTIASDSTKDVVFVTTSTGEVLAVEPPPREAPESSMIYWKRKY